MWEKCLSAKITFVIDDSILAYYVYLGSIVPP